MRRQQRPRTPAQRPRAAAARAATVTAAVPHVGRVACASVLGRQVSADCVGTRVCTFSPVPQGQVLCGALQGPAVSSKAYPDFSLHWLSNLIY